MISRLVLTLAGLYVAVSGSNANGAPQTFNTALPVAEGEFVFRERAIYKRATDDPSPANRELDVIGGISVLGYGITGDLAVFGLLPYLDKNLEITLPTGTRVTRDTNGIGDARIFGRYTLYRNNMPGRTFRVAPFAGVELPTGDNNDRDGLGFLPAPLQLGSGSWDPFFGLIVTYQTLDYEIDMQASYKVNTSADGFEFGDEAKLDASLQYRLWPRELSGNVPGFLYGVLEANLIHLAQNQMGGITVAASGGTSLFLSPGLQYVTRRWVAEAIIQLPLIQNLNGAALEDDFIISGGFRINF